MTVKGREAESDPLAPENCVELADDIIVANASRMIRKNPDLAHKTKAEVRQIVLDKHGPSK